MGYVASVAIPLLLYSIACVGAGAIFAGFFPRRPREKARIELVISFLLGQGLLGSLFHIPALAGVFTKPLLLWIILPLAGSALWTFLRAGEGKRAFLLGWKRFRAAPLGWQIVSLLAGFILVAGACSVASVMTDDARAFYMVLPKVIAASHRLATLPLYEEFTAVGLLGELQLAALFSLGMPGGSARLFCWVTALAGSVVLLSIARAAGLRERAQLIVLSMFVTSTAITLLWGSGKTDFFAAAFGLCGYYYALRSWDGESRQPATVLAGIFTGFAIVAKLSYVVAFLPGVLVLLLWPEFYAVPEAWRCRKRRFPLLGKVALTVAVFGVAASLSFLPLLIKNFVLYGDAMKTISGGFVWFSPAVVKRIILTYPLVMTYGNFWGQFGTMSPLVLAFLPLALLPGYAKATDHGAIVALFTSAAIGLFAWVVLFPAVPMPRAFLATLILLFIPAAWAAERFSSLGRLPTLVVHLAVLSMLIVFCKTNSGNLIGLAREFQTVARQQPPMAGAGDVEADGLQAVYKALNDAAEPGARVYTLTYFKFDLRPDLIQCATKSIERVSSPLWRTPADFWRRLHENGFTYIVVEDAYNETDVASLMREKPATVSMDLIAKNAGLAVYRLHFDEVGASTVLFTTREVAPGAWDVVTVR